MNFDQNNGTIATIVHSVLLVLAVFIGEQRKSNNHFCFLP
jgi:hypothetical protein